MSSFGEKTGTTPLAFESTGKPLLDWTITATSNPSGTVYYNYEHCMVEGTAANPMVAGRCAGGSSYAIPTWFPTEIGTNKYACINLRRYDGGRLSPTDVSLRYKENTVLKDGQLQLFQGEWISVRNAQRGAIDTTTFGNDIIRYGLNEDGEMVIPSFFSDSVDWEERALCTVCAIVRLTDNRPYSVEPVPSGVDGIRAQTIIAITKTNVDEYAASEIKTAKPTFTGGEYWLYQDAYTLSVVDGGYVLDLRTANYENCDFKVSLPAGSYKVIAEAYSPIEGDIRLADNVISSEKDPYFAIFSSNGDAVVNKTAVFETRNVPYIHEEYPFTLSEDTNIGFFCKVHAPDPSYRPNQGVRFAIQSSNFPTSQKLWYAPDGTVPGITSFGIKGEGMTMDEDEATPYLTITVTSESGSSQTVEIPIESNIYNGDSITMEDADIDIPTYYGGNTIAIQSSTPVSMYIKYEKIVPYDIWAEERPGLISVYDIQEPQGGYEHNGVAVLMPYEVTSDKEDSGIWDITLTHPIDEYGKWTYIVGNNVIKVNGQLFRIDSTEINADANGEYIVAHAPHISYDMRDYYITDAEFEATTGTGYVYQVLNNRVQDFPNQSPVVGEYIFDVQSDLEGEMYAKIKDQSVIEALFGAENSLAARYGGKVYRDNFHISINKSMEWAPEGYAFRLRYGTDMTKISYKIDMSDWVTNLICVNNFGEMWAKWYEYDGMNFMVHHHKTKRVHFTYSEVPPGEPMAQFIADGEALWETVSSPSISVKVSIANLRNDPKYADFLNLQNLDVGYRGTIYIEHLGIEAEMEINRIRRNELTGEVISIELGNTRHSLIRQTVLSQTIVSPNSATAKAMQALETSVNDIKSALIPSDIEGLENLTIEEMERYTIEELEGLFS